MYQNIIFEKESKEDGLKVEVNARLAGNFEVVYTDTDAQQVIEVRLYDDQDKAIAYAQSLADSWREVEQ